MLGVWQYVLSLSLKKKVLCGYLLMTVLIAATLVVIGAGVQKIRVKYDALNAMNDDIHRIIQLKADINGMRAAFLWGMLSQSPEVVESIEGLIAENIRKNSENIDKLKKGRYREKVAEIEKTWIPFSRTMADELIPLVKAGKTAEAMAIVKTVQTERVQKFMALASAVIDDSRREFGLGMETIDREIASTVAEVAIIVVVIFSGAFAFSFLFINKYIVAVLHDISSSAEKVAKGELGISVRAKTGDEFGELANDVNKIIQSMQSVLRDVADKTVYILRDATNLTLYGKDVSQKVDKDLERTAAAAVATEEMSSTIGDVARNISVVSQAAEKARATSMEGKKTIEETVSSIEEVNRQIESSSEKVKVLANLSNKIDEIVVMIKDIADQTNLLALNAAIEAARAGEQGRGFAVVADEVRKLAQRTASATADINNILSAIHSGTVDATDNMDAAVEKAGVTRSLAGRLDGSFKEIYTSFEKVSDMVHQVVSATEEQSATATEISGSLTTIAEDARESSKTVKDMARSFDKFSANAKEFLKLLDGFKDPKVEIGVRKADYVLWFHRMLDVLDAKAATFDPGELSPEKSRMGRWYYGEGSEAFKDLSAFRELEALHKELHALGVKAYEAAGRGDSASAKQHVSEAARLVDGIIAHLSRLEAAA